MHNDGDDRIRDFSGADRLVLSGVDRSEVTITRAAGGTLVEWGSDSVELDGFTASWFGLDDITFS